jgi:hypothetical protein
MEICLPLRVRIDCFWKAFVIFEIKSLKNNRDCLIGEGKEESQEDRR